MGSSWRRLVGLIEMTRRLQISVSVVLVEMALICVAAFCFRCPFVAWPDPYSILFFVIGWAAIAGIFGVPIGFAMGGWSGSFRWSIYISSLLLVLGPFVYSVLWPGYAQPTLPWWNW